MLRLLRLPSWIHVVLHTEDILQASQCVYLDKSQLCAKTDDSDNTGSMGSVL